MQIFLGVSWKNTECFGLIYPKIRKSYYFLPTPLLFPRFSLPLPIQFLRLERKQTILYHHPQREGQQPEEHQFADSKEQVGGHHWPVGIGQVVVGVRHLVC